jgi:hypothetical protein
MQIRSIAGSLLPLLAAALVACGPSGGDENNTENNTTQNSSNNTTTSMQQVGDPPETYEDSYQMRFTDMKFKPATPGVNLNLVLAGRFDQTLEYPVIVLFEIFSIDTEAETAKIRGGSGEKTDTMEQYTWFEMGGPASYDAELLPETGALVGTIDALDFRAQFKVDTEVKTTTLPIKEIVFDANLTTTDDGSIEIVDGELEGYITLEDARMAEVDLGTGSTTTVAKALKEENMNLDLDEDGTNDAWSMEAFFDARETTILDQ